MIRISPSFSVLTKCHRDTISQCGHQLCLKWGKSGEEQAWFQIWITWFTWYLNTHYWWHCLLCHKGVAGESWEASVRLCHWAPSNVALPLLGRSLKREAPLTAEKQKWGCKGRSLGLLGQTSGMLRMIRIRGLQLSLSLPVVCYWD